MNFIKPILLCCLSLLRIHSIAQLHDSSIMRHQTTRNVVFDDTDHDGISNQLDKELNTPAGCPVDTHGVQLDTDGDGLPDCRDKEKLTSQNCFPVDSNGMGRCAEPLCCQVDYFGCYMPDFYPFSSGRDRKHCNSRNHC